MPATRKQVKTKDSNKDLYDTENLVKRMNRILGQVQGVKKMIEEHRACKEVLSQIVAIKSALDGVAMSILENEASRCFQETVEGSVGENNQALKEFITLIRRYNH